MDVKSDVIIGGKVAIGGFTNLGDESPSIKFKKLTGTTAAEGNVYSFTHNLDASKILSVNTVVTDILGHFRLPNYTFDPNREYQVTFTPTILAIINIPGNSSYIANCPYTILVIYEE